MTYLELVFYKNSYRLELFSKTLLSKGDPFLGKRKYGITISSQRDLSVWPVIGIFYGTNDQEKWINHVGFVEEDTILEYDKDGDYTQVIFTVEGFHYHMRSGTVHTVETKTRKVLEKPEPCWILVEEQKDKTPLGSLNYVCFKDRRGFTQDTESVIKHIVSTDRVLKEMREKMCSQSK